MLGILDSKKREIKYKKNNVTHVKALYKLWLP